MLSRLIAYVIVCLATLACAGASVAVDTTPWMEKLLSVMRVSAEQSSRFAGAYRHRVSGAINWYFMLSAMTLAPQAFSLTDRKSAIEAAIGKGVVGPRASNANYDIAGTFVVLSSGNVYFVNIAGTTAATEPAEPTSPQAGTFLRDGSAVLEFTGLRVPTEWRWFLIDIDSNLLTPIAPDSNDAYAGLLLAAAGRLDPSAGWLNAPSGHPNLSRLNILTHVANHNIIDAMNGALTQTFQGNKATAVSSYDVRFLADNVEAWRGLIALSRLLFKAGEYALSAAAKDTADILSDGVESLWIGATYRTYAGQFGAEGFEGAARFVSDLRFHIWPSLHGLNSQRRASVINHTMARVPSVLTDALDTYPLSEWFFASGNYGTLISRTNKRLDRNILIQDAALAILAESLLQGT